MQRAALTRITATKTTNCHFLTNLSQRE